MYLQPRFFTAALHRNSNMHTSFLLVALFAALTTRVTALCCIAVQGGCARADNTNTFFNKDFFVPGGAHNANALSTAEFDLKLHQDAPAVCCCMAASASDCDSRCSGVGCVRMHCTTNLFLTSSRIVYFQRVLTKSSEKEFISCRHLRLHRLSKNQVL